MPKGPEEPIQEDWGFTPFVSLKVSAAKVDKLLKGFSQFLSGQIRHRADKVLRARPQGQHRGSAILAQ
jgi:hypothetical protein